MLVEASGTKTKLTSKPQLSATLTPFAQLSLTADAGGVVVVAADEDVTLTPDDLVVVLEDDDPPDAIATTPER